MPFATCRAELTVERPLKAALSLFSAEGEREWADGWNPTFPVAERTDGVGAVFVTAHGEQTTTWVMTDQDEHGVRYARITPGMTAGTIAVSVVRVEGARTRLRVTYDLTALSSAGADWLRAFADGFTDYIAHWETAIAGHASRRH